MKTAERQLKKMHRRTLALLALLVAIAFPAAAHNRTPLGDLSSTTSPAIAWNEPLGETSADELPIVDAATIAAFDEAARIDIDLPANPLAELDAHLAAITSPPETDLLPIVSGLENRCSGLPVSLTEANLKETGELSLKLHWGRDHVRNRWFDPNTGTWLTPDPLGYQDSSNLYAFAGGDPVNGRDPTGLLCGRQPGESWLAWGTRCAEDVGNVGVAFLEEPIIHPVDHLARTGKSFGGFVAGSTKAVGTAAAAPLLPVITTYAAVKGTVDAYAEGDVEGVKQAALDSLPLVGTGRSFARAWDEYDAGNYFAGGMGIGETTVRAEGDALLAYGGVRWTQSKVRAWGESWPSWEGAQTPSTSAFKTWNEFQAGTKGQFASRAEAAKAWDVYKDANGIVTGTARSSGARAQYLRSLVDDYRTPSWMKQWLKQGRTPPGYEVDHIVPLSIGGPDTPANMRLQGADLHDIHHKYYDPWNW